MKTHKLICHMQNGWPLNHQRTGILIPGKPGTVEVTDAQLAELQADCRVLFVESTPAPARATKATPAPLPTPEDKPEEKPKRRGRK
jgi:hypothetical protein